MITTQQIHKLHNHGMYIRRNRQGAYNLGFSALSRGVLATFPIYEEAYIAFEQIVERFWESHNDDFFTLARSMTQHLRR